MANKARRRPSWKNKRDGWTLVLLNEEDDSLFESVFLKKGNKQIKNMIKRYGRSYVEYSLREVLVGRARDIIERRERTCVSP